MQAHYYFYLLLFYLSTLNSINCTPATDVQSAGHIEIGDVIKSLDIDPSYLVNEVLSIIDILGPHQQNTEDISLNITELAPKYGYQLRQYHTVTDDGYRLTIFRIKRKGPVVFLMHGLFNSADDWVVAGPDSGLAYILASAGYDVWMGNARGTKYSRQHISLSPGEPQFWHFSWDEIGRYDLPAMIDYVLSATNKSKLTYIGFSQGTTSFFVMCSERPEYNDKINLMIALSPVAWMAHVKSPFVKIGAPYILNVSWVLRLFKYYELMPRNRSTMDAVCGVGNGIICLSALFAVCGFDYEQVNKTNTQSIFGHIPGGASLNQVLHYLQNVISKDFRRYDHGEDRNEELYGNVIPPKYPVEKIKAPIVIFYSTNDWFSNTADVQTLKRKLQNIIGFYRVPWKKFNHLDYLYAKDVKNLVYLKVLQLLSKVK